jgi:hypothetical protein
MFIGTKQEKKALMKKVIPLYLSNERWIDNVKLQYDDKEYNNIREALLEAMDLEYIENVKAIRTIKGGICFHHAINDSPPILTKKGERFLNSKL